MLFIALSRLQWSSLVDDKHEQYIKYATSMFSLLLFQKVDSVSQITGKWWQVSNSIFWLILYYKTYEKTTTYSNEKAA